ncbi:MAG: hypothetical protein AB7J13_11645, partial [Pyrinomonadaceae bacterium]
LDMNFVSNILSVFYVLIGLWFLASAATERGLLPNGHGGGRIIEVGLGLLFLGYGIFRLRKVISRK